MNGRRASGLELILELEEEMAGERSLRIRRAGPADAIVLSHLARRSKAQWGYSADWLAAWQHELTITPFYIGANRVLVAESDSQAIGMCALEERDGGWTLEHLWVDPGAIGSGIGRALVEAALGMVRTLRPGPVRVESDPNAAGFYLQMGAKPAGTVPAAMPGAADRVLPVFVFEAQ